MNTKQAIVTKAYTLALSTYLNEYPQDRDPKDVFDNLEALIESEDVTVWAPFEYEDISELTGNISNLVNHAVSLFGDDIDEAEETKKETWKH